MVIYVKCSTKTLYGNLQLFQLYLFLYITYSSDIQMTVHRMSPCNVNK